MTDRPTVDSITSAQLAELYADLDRYEEAIGDLNEHVINFQRRAERAEAALDRVHHVADLIAAGAPWTANHQNLAGRIRDAATVPGDQTAPAVPAAPAPVDWRRVLDGFQALLDAFPAELHPSGPAVSCRPQPAQLVARWRNTAQTARQQYAADQTTKEN